MEVNKTKLIVWLIAGIYAFSYATSLASWHFIDSLDLLIHEAGHFIFSFLGEFIMVLGGSFLQVVLPLIFAGYFYIKEQYFSFSLTLYWVGINLLNVSVYAADAVKMQLTLLGGGNGWETGGHDWNYLLIETGLLHHTKIVGNIIFYCGLAVMFTAFFLSLWCSQNQEKIVTYYE